MFSAMAMRSLESGNGIGAESGMDMTFEVVVDVDPVVALSTEKFDALELESSVSIITSVGESDFFMICTEEALDVLGVDDTDEDVDDED